MKMLIGGAVGAVLGVITSAIWWKELFNLLAGSIPILLLIGGGLALYLGYDDFKEIMKKPE